MLDSLIADARQRADSDPDEYPCVLKWNKDMIGNVFKASPKPKSDATVPIVSLELENSVLTIETKGIFFGTKKKKYALSTCLNMRDISQTAFDVTFQVKDSPKLIKLRFSNKKDKARWMVGLLLNIKDRYGAPPADTIKKSEKSNNKTASTTRTARRCVSTIKKLPPNPEWLTEGGKRGPEYWKDNPYDERSLKHTPDVLAFASQLGKLHISLTFERGWPWAAWGVDIVQQILEMTYSSSSCSRQTISRRRSQIITPTFFVALLTINGKIKEKEKLYQQVVRTFREYQHDVVIPAIRDHSHKLQEFARRWNLHKIFSEYMRRIFIDLDKNTDGQCRESISSVALRSFQDVWNVLKEELIQKMLDIISEQRQGRHGKWIEDEPMCRMMETCKEIMCVLGVLNAPRVNQIKFLVSPEKANVGRFTIMPEMMLLNDVSSSMVIHTTDKASRTKIVVERYISQVYRKEFECRLIKSTEKYCKFLSSKWMSHSDVTSYLRKFVHFYEDETSRVKSFLHCTTLKTLQKTVVECMLIGNQAVDKKESSRDDEKEQEKENNLEGKEDEEKKSDDNVLYVRLLQNLEGGLFSCLMHQRFEDVGRFYECFTIVNSFGFSEALNLASEIFGQFVLTEGERIVETRTNVLKSLRKKFRNAHKTYIPPSNAHEFVDSILELHRMCMTVHKERFHSNARFQKFMNISFEKILNRSFGKNETGTERILVEYMHMILSKGKTLNGTRLSTSQIESTCMKVLDLVDHVFSKDKFLEEYAKRLQNRLLDTAYKEYGIESAVLSRIKLKIGQVSSMEVMLKDMKQVKHMYTEWSEVCNSVKSLSHCSRLHPVVLTEVSWKFHPEPKQRIQIPVAMNTAIDSFLKFYSKKCPQRQICVRHDLSSVILSYKCSHNTTKISYRITMTAPQACVLMLFNKENMLTIPKIVEFLNLEIGRVKRIMLSLLMRPSKSCRSGLVIKVKRDGVPPLPLLEDDEFCLCSNFKNTKVAFTLRRPQLENMSKSLGTKPKRNIRLEAAIVRTMKANRVMLERKLILEAMQQVSKFFKPDVRSVKKTVEALMSRGYVKRCESDAKSLEYVA